MVANAVPAPMVQRIRKVVFERHHGIASTKLNKTFAMPKLDKSFAAPERAASTSIPRGFQDDSG